MQVTHFQIIWQLCVSDIKRDKNTALTFPKWKWGFRPDAKRALLQPGVTAEFQAVGKLISCCGWNTEQTGGVYSRRLDEASQFPAFRWWSRWLSPEGRRYNRSSNSPSAALTFLSFIGMQVQVLTAYIQYKVFLDFKKTLESVCLYDFVTVSKSKTDQVKKRPKIKFVHCPL